MVKLLPGGFDGGLVSFKKRCTNIQLHDDGVTVPFADGTSEKIGAVIGCDGIESRVRNILHGGQDKYEPQFTGKYAYRCLVPVEDAIKVLGEVAALNRVLTLGYGGHLVTFPNHGSNWVVPATVEDALDDFKDCSEPVKKLLSLFQKPDKWGLFNLPPLKTCIKDGRICLLGDCARASTPHLGAGAGMALEDAGVRSRLLGEIRTPNRAHRTSAFAAHDAVRRERTQVLVTKSRSVGLLYDFQIPGVEDDATKIRVYSFELIGLDSGYGH